jgi:hypothetical protein
MRQVCPLTPLEFLASIRNKARERNKRESKEKEEIKLSLLVDNMILYLKDSKDSIKK